MADTDSVAALEGIAESLRRQRRDLQNLHDAASNGETTKVLEKLEELRRRADDTRRRQQD